MLLNSKHVMDVASGKIFKNEILISRLTAYYELTKPGITFMVLASMLIGFIAGSEGLYNYFTMLHAVIGTFLIASGTAAHNQFIERNLDKLMNRTSSRPIPSERISSENAFIFSITLILAGLIYLLYMVNFTAGIISALTTLLYLGIYTPMKRRTFLNVIVGSIPGALPPVGGWAAATGSVTEPAVWLLFAIILLWQIPHVLAIAWVCNDDYTSAGFRMLPNNDASGLKTSTISLLSLIALIPTIYLMFWIGMADLLFLATGLLATLVYNFYGLQFLFSRENKEAKKLMFASFIYLPVLWIFLLADVLII